MARVDTVIQNNNRIMTNMLLCDQTCVHAVNFRTHFMVTFSSVTFSSSNFALIRIHFIVNLDHKIFPKLSPTTH